MADVCTMVFSKIAKLKEQNHQESMLYRINTDKLSSAVLVHRSGQEQCTSRLFAFPLLGLTLDRLFYLDADVVCKGDISQLLHLGLNGAVAAVVKDVEPMQEKAVSRLSDPELLGQYFNSGVVYLDLKKWADAKLTEKALSILASKDNVYKYPDQML
ncbi:glycosyltransferase family 8 protein [Escherichia coli]|uniref:glycosyltransferase family 8 protein n=1 Tax=Escherichia coli TaxID=562 RepID=UPI00203C87FF|nr:glycosyltransferase [Escherichia coli]